MKMGFDNECIKNMQSLPGEYFCPVCRLLVYPNEALQTQCTHLYCKPCLTYIVGSSRACPYDGYLVAEADSKPLIEVNKSVAEAIGNIQVHCLYHRSGCNWEGSLSDCTTHCTGCVFGDSPVVCNRCGTQIVHRQVQEHALNCPGVQPQMQQAETMPATTAEQTQACTQEPVSQGMTTLAAVQGQSQSSANAAQIQVLAASPQAVAQGPPTLHHASTPDQWYRQQQHQYQQYYQQYPGYDPYSQQYQQYDSYQQQQHLLPHQQPVVQGYPQSQPYMQLQPESQSQSQPHTQPAPQVQAHSQVQPQNVSHSQVHLSLQSQIVTQSQIQDQPNQQQQQQQFHSSAQPIPQVQPQTHPPVALPGPPVGPANLQPHILPQPQPHANPNIKSQPRAPYMLQAPVQQNPHAQFLPPNSSVEAVTGHQSYLQPQAHQQAPSVTPHPPPILLHNTPQQQGLPQDPPNQVPEQFPIHQQSQMRPSNPPLQSAIPTPHVPQSSMLPPQGQHSTAPNLPHPGQPVSYQTPMLTMPQQPPQPHQIQGYFGGFPSSQGPPFLIQQTKQSQQSLLPQGPQYPYTHPQLQQSFSGSQGLSHPTQRPMLMNQGLQSQPFPQPTVGSAGPSRAQIKQVQFGPSQLHQNQRPGYVQTTSQSQSDAQNTMRPCLDPQPGSDAVVKQETTADNPQHIDVTNSNVSYKEHNEVIVKPTDDKGKPPSGLSDKGSLHNHNVDKTSGSTLHTEDMPRRAKNAEDLVAKRRVEDDSQSVGDGQKDSYLAKSSDRYSVLVTKEKEEHTVDKTLLSQSEEIPELQQDASEFGQSSQGVGTSAHTQALGSVAEKEIPNGPHQGHILGNTNQNSLPTQENSVNFPQLPHQGVGGPKPREWRGVLPSGQMQAKNIGQPVHVVPIPEQQRFPFGPTVHQTHDWTTKLPLASDHSVPHSIPFAGATHDRFPVPYGHQMQGQAVGHLRPQEPAQPPAVPGVLPGPGFPPLGRGSCNVGHSQGPQGRIPPPYAAGRLFSHGEPLSGSPLGGPHSQIRHPSSANPMDAEIFTRKRPGKFEANQPDPPQAVSAKKVSPGQPGSGQLNMMKVNGASSKGIAGGILDASDASIERDLPEERFKHLPEERYKPFPEEGFRPPLKERFKAFSADPSHHSDRREFKEDLKQFPHPAYFDGENAHKSDSYFLSKSVDRGQHSFDRAPHVFNHDGAAKTDSIPFFSSGLGMHPADIGERLRFCDDSLVRRVGRPEFTHSVSEFGRHSLRSPSGEYPGIVAGRFSSSSGDLGRGGRLHLEEFDCRETQGFGDHSKAFSIPDSINSLFHESRFPVHAHMGRGELDGPVNVPPFLRNGDLVGPDVLPSHLRPGESLPHLRGEHLAPRILPSRLRAGDTLGPNLLHIGEATGFDGFQSHLRSGESFRGGSFASRMPRGESGFGLQTHGYQSGGGFFDRRRKPGSMGWCRICKIDCETVEGLDLHSQTREHQKMAMDLVLMIKHGNAKKQRLFSEDHISKEDGNKNRKAALDVKK